MSSSTLDLTVLHIAAARLGEELTPAAEQAFRRYAQLLLEWNQRINLTGLNEWSEIQRRFLVESLGLLPWVDQACVQSPACRVIDVGTGAGIPGIPLKILRPNLSLTLLDATAKKVRFLELVVRELALLATTPIHERAETLAHDPTHRGQYDVVTARALAHLAVALELTIPFLRVDGLALFPKGPEIEPELRESQRALEILGGEIEAVEPMPLADLVGTIGTIVVVRAVRPAPPQYPRRPGLPAKRPLR